MEDTNNSQKEGWDWRTRKPNNLLVVNAGPSTGFFRKWCILMKPMVGLTNKEIDVVSSFLKQRWELSKVISDPAILDSQLMSNDTKDKVIAECNITRPYFYVLMSNLKKNNVITDAGINPHLVPNIRSNDNGTFQLLVLFKDDLKDGL